MAGEMTTGSIIGFLRLDITDWLAKLEAAKAAADDLGRADPDVTIHTNAVEAVAQLEAVAAATDHVGQASDRVDASQQRSIRSGRALVTTIVALAPALVPLSAAAAGTGIALAGMGTAGVLAVLGIKKEMAAGTTEGLLYKAAVAGVQSDLTRLEQVAASGVLRPFLAVVADLHQRMPALSTDVGVMSAALGNTAVPVVRGFLNVFQTLLPLMEAGAADAVQVAQAFERWSTGSGLQQFGNYAESVLPSVINLLEQLVPAVVRVVAAFAPMGGTVISVLTAVASAINALPMPVLEELAIVGTSVYLAFRSWTAMTAVIDGARAALARLAGQEVLTAGATQALTLAAGGIAAVLGIAMIVWSNHERVVQENQQAIASYTDALRESNGVIDQNVRAMAAKQLSDSGALQAAKDLGYSLADVTSAALGDAPALARVNAHTDALARSMQDASSSGGDMSATYGDIGGKISLVTDAVGKNATQLKTATQAQRNQAAALQASTPVQDAATAALNRQAAGYHTTVAALNAATTAQAKQKASAAAATVAMQIENNAAGLLKAALDQLNGKNLSAAQAQNAFEQATVNLNTQLHNGSKAIKGNSDAAISNRGSLLGLVTAAEQSAQAYGDMRGSSEAGRQKLIQLRTAIINNAVAHGVDRAAVTAYIDKVLAIPRTVPPTKLQIDDAAALSAINNFQARLYSLNGHTVTTYVRTVTSQVAAMNSGAGGVGGVGSHGMLRKANGGVVEYFAAGGFSENHVAQIAPAGVSRVWNEPETQGEAYIPLAPSKRARSLEVWQETGRRLGATDDGAGVRLHPATVVELANAMIRAAAARPVIVSASAMDAALAGVR